MGVHLEITAAVLRVGSELEQFGDPYEFAATVLIRGKRAEIVGGAGSFDPKWRRQIAEELRGWGIEEVIYDRKTSKPRQVRLRARAHRNYPLRVMRSAGEG